MGEIRNRNLAAMASLFIKVAGDGESPSSEELVIKYPVRNLAHSQFDFDLSEYSNITELAFQPMMQQCLVDIEEVTLLMEDESLVHVKFKSNAVWGLEDHLVFETVDPRIFISEELSRGDAKSLRIRMNYRLTDLSTLKVIVSYILASGQHFKPARQVPYKDYKALERQLSNIRNSLSYKIGFGLSSPLRMFSRDQGEEQNDTEVINS